MGFWVSLGIIVFSAAISYFLTPTPPRPKDQPKPQFEDLEVPTVDASSPIPRVYGTKWVKSANVVWYGDLKTKEIKA